MAIIKKYRTISPSNRQASSNTYKVSTNSVTVNDILIVFVDHESKPYKNQYAFTGTEISGRKSISFRVEETEESVEVSWVSIVPSI
ncbi:MAG: hypothetical protein N4A72_08340 [Bacteroidales bacterium]|jgi:hypothetical protein|nr:hypothetical protein [Bacteroidales bacterium]